MPVVSRKILYVKLSIVAVAFGLAIFGFHKYSAKYEKVSASAYGPSPAHTGAPAEGNCTACHSDYPVNSGGGSVLISNLPAYYQPGQQFSLTVKTTHVEATSYGFQLTAVDASGARAGNLILPLQSPPQMQLVNGNVNGRLRQYIEHTSDGIVPTVENSKSWTFNWTAPAQRVGKIGLYASGNGANGSNSTGGDYIYTSSKSISSSIEVSNFDADGKSDIAVFRPSTGYWYSLNSSNGNYTSALFGASGDKVVASDYDGDGKTDFAVWRPSNGTWYVLKSSGGFVGVAFGQNGDVPVVGDYDGDFKADFAVFRPSNGYWYYLKSSDNNSFSFVQFGASTDKTAQGDYDGDGKTDIAVFRPSDGYWYIQRSNLGFTGVPFGANGDKPVPADYDGDGKTDVAVYRPSNGSWYRLNSSNNSFSGAAFGISTDKPVPADYDGDGKADIAVNRSGNWYVLRSSDNSFYGIAFGDGNDIPVPTGNIAP